jgi:hypothetical protein
MRDGLTCGLRFRAPCLPAARATPSASKGATNRVANCYIVCSAFLFRVWHDGPRPTPTPPVE